MSIDEIADSRLGPLVIGKSSCLVCGKKINRADNGCCIESPKAGGIKMCAHRDCVNGMTAFELAAKYQSAIDASLRGGKERLL